MNRRLSVVHCAPPLQSYDYYIEAYPDGPDKVLNFLDYNLLLTLQLDHIYRWGPCRFCKVC